MPCHTFLRCGEYLKFLRGLGKIRQKGVTNYTFFFRRTDYLKFLMGLGKLFTKKCAQLHVLFAVETILSFGWDLEKIWQKGVTSYTFFRSACYLKFWIGLRKVSTKMCAQLHIFSLWRLTWVFDGTCKNFYKKVCLVTRFFAVESILSFRVDLESFDKKVWPVTRFRTADYLKFLDGT